MVPKGPSTGSADNEEATKKAAGEPAAPGPSRSCGSCHHKRQNSKPVATIGRRCERSRNTRWSAKLGEACEVKLNEVRTAYFHYAIRTPQPLPVQGVAIQVQGRRIGSGLARTVCADEAGRCRFRHRTPRPACRRNPKKPVLGSPPMSSNQELPITPLLRLGFNSVPGPGEAPHWAPDVLG